jgi:hypothetical protein
MPNIFPDLTPDTEQRRHKKFETRVRAAGGGLSTNIPHPFEQHLFSLDWSILYDTELDQILAHFRAVSGSWTYFEFTPRAIADLAIGTGTGAAGQVITLPTKSTSGLVIKVAGVTVANYTTSTGTGADGEDRITSTVGGFTTGAAVTMSASNASTRRRHYLWYTTEELGEEPVEANLYRLHLDLEEAMP